MNGDDITEGLAVRVTTHRLIAGRSWAGVEGVVRYTFRRASDVPDWVTVQVPDDGYILIGFTPGEIEAAR